MTLTIIIAIFVLGISLYDYYDSKDWQQITCVDRINIVFEERNKKYGAYSIRRDYNDLVLFILLGMVGLFGLFTIITSGMRLTVEEARLPIVVMDTTLLTLEAPPLEHIETIPTPYKIVGGGGSGTPDNSKYDPTPNPMMSKEGSEITTHKTEHGKGNKDTGKNPNEEASTRVKSPFSGSGGSGGGNKGGIGTGFGNDDGSGTGPGHGPGGNVTRKLLTQLDTGHIESDENCTVTVTVRIDADGNVVGTPTVKRDKTTTSNSVIIDAVIRAVKSQAKFNKVEGASIIALNLPVKVSAN